MNKVRVFIVYNEKELIGNDKALKAHFVVVDSTLPDDEIKTILHQHRDELGDREFLKPTHPLEFFGYKEIPSILVTDSVKCKEITSMLSTKESIVAAMKNNILVVGYDTIEIVYLVVHSIKDSVFNWYKQQLISTIGDIGYEEHMSMVLDEEKLEE